MKSSRTMVWSLAVTGLVGVLAVAGCGSSGATQTVRTGAGQIRAGGPRVAGAGDKFAGLVWTGDVQSIAAQWRVPRIRPGSQPGRAATWIGAQGFMPDGAQPFIQIGTREELQPVGASSGPGGQGKLLYEAFWTDVVRGLHPVSLFAVHPGDAVTAQMSLRDRRWTLTLSDRTTGRRRRLSTGEETVGRFRLALWLQEDPTRTANHRVFAYPDLSPVNLSALTVNGARPSAAALKSTWMSLPHAYLGPTTAAGDAFSVIPRVLSSAGAAYLSVAGPLNSELMAYLIKADRWRAKTPQSVIRTATDRLISAMAGNVARLRARRWPAVVAALVRRLASDFATQVSALRRAVAAGPAAVLAAFSDGAGDGGQESLTDTIRQRLGVRQTSY